MYLLNQWSNESRSWPQSSLFKFANHTDVSSLLAHVFDVTTVLIPVVSVFGVLGNVTGICILSRRSHTGSSSILLLALAVADTMYILGINNIPLHVYMDGNVGFSFSQPVALILYVLLHVEMIVESIGRTSSMAIPVLITYERIVAVFLPLKFARIITPRRIRFLICCLYLIWIPDYTFLFLLAKYEYTLDKVTNITVGRIVMSDQFNVYRWYYTTASRFYVALLGPVSVGLVICGSILICVKVKVQETRRKKLMCTTKKRPDQKTKRLKSSLKQEEVEESSEVSTEIFLVGYQSSLDCAVRNSTSEQVYHNENGLAISSMCDNCVCSATSKIKKESHNSLDSQHDQSKNIPQDVNLKMSTETSKQIEGNTNSLSKTTKLLIANYPNRKNKDTQKTNETNSPANQNKETLASNSRARRTTKILLSVSLVYSITYGLGFLTIYVFNEARYDYGTTLIAEHVSRLAMCINSTTNFIVYVVLNPKFRKTLRLFYLFFKKIRCR